jgi:hypothetical protein
MQQQGGCLCGAVRYEISHSAGDVADYCHCRQCQLASGAPAVAWLQVAPARFRLTQGAPKNFSSSPHATRWFCPHCGTPLYMTDDSGHAAGITLASLDTPQAIQPTVHGWHCERIAWFQIKDSLPRYDKSPPYDL